MSKRMDASKNEEATMGRIRVNTEQVMEAGGQLSAGSGRLAEIGHALRGAVGGLNVGAWEGVSRGRAEPLLGRVGPESRRLANDLAALGRTLERVASVFEEEDGTAARNLSGMPWVSWDAGGGSYAGSPPPPDDNPDFRGVRGAEEAEYGLMSGQPFTQGIGDESDILPSDVRQGGIGDCYLMASLAAIALQDPGVIRRMIRDNGDGTYTVTLHQNMRGLAAWQPQFYPVEVVVTPEFPLEGGDLVFAQSVDGQGDRQELWTALVEKAYAQANGGYHDIEGGWGHAAMEAVTGVESQWFSPSSATIDTFADHFEAGNAITASSLGELAIWGENGEIIIDIPDASDRNPLFQDHTLCENHEYYVTGVDRANGSITVRNPWGWNEGEVTLSFAEFQGAFRRASVNPLAP
jgi:uncharacterized protein YukE